MNRPTADDVRNWLKAGSSAEEGVLLLRRAGAPSLLLRMVAVNPASNVGLMKRWLFRTLGIKDVEQPSSRAFRDEFPFLDDPSCPMELQALATKKITSYRAYVKLHKQLRDCSSLVQCAVVSRQLINNYLENRMIWEELEYYRTHGAILGKHPLMAFYARKKNMLNMTVKQLFREQKRLKANIWRVKSELAKGDKPHLEPERRARLAAYEAELAEINRLLDEE
jgi:hypothetical protein|nr:MAG TPA: hypothetical protein [Caudoviricetes sp.]